MSAQIIPLVTHDAVDEAWAELATHNAKLLTNPELIVDRSFVETQAKLHRRFCKLFNMMDERP